MLRDRRTTLPLGYLLKHGQVDLVYIISVLNTFNCYNYCIIIIVHNCNFYVRKKRRQNSFKDIPNLNNTY